jgi:hypothetical protein
MSIGSGVLCEQIRKETPLTYQLMKSYEFDHLTYVVLSTEVGFLFVRKPSAGERLRDFEKSTLIVLPDYSFFIVLYSVSVIEEADRLVANLNSIIKVGKEL